MIFGNPVDRAARRPSGVLGYLLYRSPSVTSRVSTSCSTSCRRGLAIDHSSYMVANAARLNRHAVSSGRLTVLSGNAASLPAGRRWRFRQGLLSQRLLLLFPDPQVSIAEMARVIKPGGQIALVTSSPEFRAQIARFSKTMADGMRFDTLETLDGWMREAGLVVEEMMVAPNAGSLIIARKESAA